MSHPSPALFAFSDLPRLASVAIIAVVLLLTGCSEEVVAPQPDIEISDSERAKCPESPFRPEFPIAPKAAAFHAVASPVNYDITSYTSWGKFIRNMQGVYDPNATSTGTRTYLNWDGRDAAGQQVASGYYFMVVKFTDPVSGTSTTKATCIFWVNDADLDKLK